MSELVISIVFLIEAIIAVTYFAKTECISKGSLIFVSIALSILSVLRISIGGFDWGPIISTGLVMLIGLVMKKIKDSFQ